MHSVKNLILSQGLDLLCEVLLWQLKSYSGTTHPSKINHMKIKKLFFYRRFYPTIPWCYTTQSLDLILALFMPVIFCR